MSYNWKELGIELKTSKSDGQTKAICPNCKDTRSDKSDRSLSCNLTTGAYNCHYCGFTGYAKDPSDNFKFRDMSEKKPFKRPNIRNNTNLSDKAVKWFESRGISQQTLVKMRIGEGLEYMHQHGKEMNTIQFNYFKSGELVNIKFRTGDKKFKLVSGAELIFYNLDSVVGKNNVIVTEGEADTLSYLEVGFESVVSVPNGGKNIGDYLDDYLEEYFSDKETIYIASDTDSVGVGLRDELIKRFGAERCKIVTYGEGCKDANEHLIKYGQESLRNTIKSAYEPKLDGVFKLEDFQDNLDKLYSDGLQAGLKIGHKNIDDKITWETKRLAIITGVPSSGKSEFIDEICTRLNILHGWKVGYFSPENSPMELHISKIVSKITGKKFSKESLSYAEYKQAKEYINNNFFFTNPSDNYSISNILDKAKILVRKHGIKVFVIDPYNNIDPERGSSESEGDEVRYKLKKMQDFCRRNDVLLMLMAHPRKMIKRDDGSFEVPTMYDISGSAHFYNMADYGLAVARDYVNQSVEVHIQKVKFKHLGENGMATFKYNFPNGRYVPYSGEAVINWDNSNMLVEKIKQDESNADIPIEYQYDDTTVMPNNNFYTQSNDECPF